GADLAAERLAYAFGGGGVAFRLLLDNTLEQASHEGDAGGLDRLQVDGRKEMRLLGIARAERGIGEDFLYAAEACPLRAANDRHRVRCFHEIGGGRRLAAERMDPVVTQRRHDGPSLVSGYPHPRNQRTGGAIGRERRLDAETQGHAFLLLSA